MSNWTKPAARFCDGHGFDWKGKERLSMTKQIGSTISMLKGFTMANLNASYETLKKFKVFDVQMAERTITLTETSYDNESFKYLSKAVRTTRISIEYEERYNWLRTFELLAYLLVELKEQMIRIGFHKATAFTVLTVV
ncbi:hypothetical protein RMCBS344292_13768 [Rhizopus microsporus]|nr:hypothetical protein RMCBS344292_13768 [Rhizopus microsporus]